MTPLMVEQPFTLYIGEGISVEGRIDAIFEREDGVWEVVDYKTGARRPRPAPARDLRSARSRRSGGSRRQLRGCYCAQEPNRPRRSSMIWSRSFADLPPL